MTAAHDRCKVIGVLLQEISAVLLQQISAGDLRGMVRADAVGLVLGALLVVAGLFGLTLFAVKGRRQMAPLIWLGVFAFLYGLRLLARAGTFRLGFDFTHQTWEYLAAVITYTVPIPIVFFVRAIAPNWRRFTTWQAVALTAFAVYGIASDAILHHANSARTPNNLIVITLIAGVLVWLFRPGLTPTRELWMVRVGVLTVSLAALADNLRGIGVLAFAGPDIEPFGFIVAVACLGTIVTWRVIGDARRLVALDRELSIARQIQSSILPQAVSRVAGLTVAARYRPMTAVAGDFYDFLQIDGERLGVLVADVAGHGVPAALIASMVKVALAAQQGRADRPAHVLAGMNQTLCGRLAGQYVTAAYLCIDGRSGVIRYAAAGHPPMLRSTGRGLDVREVEKNGLLLGFTEDATYEELEQPLDPGDRLLLYTDGLVEAPNAADDFFGLARVKHALAAAARLPPEAAADALLGTLDAWSGQPARDDLTIVLVDWKATPITAC